MNKTLYKIAYYCGAIGSLITFVLTRIAVWFLLFALGWALWRWLSA